MLTFWSFYYSSVKEIPLTSSFLLVMCDSQQTHKYTKHRTTGNKPSTPATLACETRAHHMNHWLKHWSCGPVTTVSWPEQRDNKFDYNQGNVHDGYMNEHYINWSPCPFFLATHHITIEIKAAPITITSKTIKRHKQPISIPVCTRDSSCFKFGLTIKAYGGVSDRVG